MTNLVPQALIIQDLTSATFLPGGTTVLSPAPLALNLQLTLSLVIQGEDPYGLIVEDGTGIPNANSYCSLAAANAYFLGRRLFSSAWTAASDSLKISALKQASNVLDNEFFWSGEGPATDHQGLQWPRLNARDRDNRKITGLPQRIVDATCEVAFYIMAQERLLARQGVGTESIAIDTLKIIFDKKSPPLLFPEYVSRMLNGFGVPVRSATQIRNTKLYRV